MEHLAPLVAAVAKDRVVNDLQSEVENLQWEVENLEADNSVTIQLTGADGTTYGSGRLQLSLCLKAVARGDRTTQVLLRAEEGIIFSQLRPLYHLRQQHVISEEECRGPDVVGSLTFDDDGVKVFFPPDVAQHKWELWQPPEGAEPYPCGDDECDSWFIAPACHFDDPPVPFAIDGDASVKYVSVCIELSTPALHDAGDTGKRGGREEQGQHKALEREDSAEGQGQG